MPGCSRTVRSTSGGRAGIAQGCFPQQCLSPFILYMFFPVGFPAGICNRCIYKVDSARSASW